MSFVVSGLTAYTERATQMLRAGVLFNDNLSKYELQTGIKYKEYLNYITASPTIANTTCGTPTDGTTTITEKTITVFDYRATDKLCYADLEKKALGLIDVPKSVTQAELDVIKTKVEHDLWIGDDSGTDFFDGWLTQIQGASDEINATTATVSASNIDDIVIDMISKASNAMWARGILTIKMSMSNFNLYKQNRLAADYYRDANADFGPLEMWAFGYEGQVKVEAIVGLGTTTDMIMTWDKNLVVGTDEISQVSSAEWVNDPITKYVYFNSQFKLGCSVKFTNECVSFKHS